MVARTSLFAKTAAHRSRLSRLTRRLLFTLVLGALPMAQQMAHAQSPAHYNLKTDCGAPMDGVHPDTAAFATCFALMSNAPGVIDIPPGVVRTNLVITQNGITINGSGWGYGLGKLAPTANYWMADNPLLPILQFANDDGNLYSGILVRDVVLNCQQNSAEYGFRIANGSYTNVADHLEVMGCSVAGIQALGGTSSVFAAKTKVTNFHVAAYMPGAIAIDLSDPNSNSTHFNNDHQFVSGSISSSSGAITLHCDSSGAQFSGVKMDLGQEGGVVVEQHNGVNPALYFSSTSIDSSTSTDTVVLFKGLGDPLSSTVHYPNFMAGFPGIDGVSMAVTNTTTGTPAIDGSKTLVVADATGAVAGKRVLVRTTSINAKTYSATIVSVSGTTLTLDIGPTVSLGTNVPVEIGWNEQGQKGFNTYAQALNGGSLSLGDQNKKDYGLPGLQPVIFGARGGGSVSPYNSTDIVSELGTRGADFLTDGGAQSISAANISRVTTTITVNTVSAHGALVGDLFVLRGANEPGYNGTYAVVSVPDTTHLTVTSSVSGSGSPTGTSIQYWVVKNVSIASGYVSVPTGFRMKQNDGLQPIITAANSGKSLYITPPSGGMGSGDVRFGYGSALEGTTTEVFKTENAQTFAVSFGLNGGAGLRLGPNANSFTKPSLRLGDAASDPGVSSIGTDGLLYDSGGQLKYRTGTANANVLLSTNALLTSGTLPTVSGCGTSPLVATGATSVAGEVTEGTGASGCTISFVSGYYANPPFCTVTAQAGLAFSYTITASAITITNIGAMSSSKIDYVCIGH